MHLIIDTNKARFAVAAGNESQEQIAWADLQQEQSLVQEAVKAAGGEIDSIFLIQGKGGFSQTREGVVFANLLKKLKGTPLRLIPEEKTGDSVSEWLKLPEAEKFDPEYYMEPNIRL